MMRLALALYAEGDTDDRFLPLIIERTSRKVLAERSHRHREVDLRPLYAPLGQRISLDRLSNVPSYQQFVDDLTATLRTLNLLK